MWLVSYFSLSTIFSSLDSLMICIDSLCFKKSYFYWNSCPTSSCASIDDLNPLSIIIALHCSLEFGIVSLGKVPWGREACRLANYAIWNFRFWIMACCVVNIILNSSFYYLWVPINCHMSSYCFYICLLCLWYVTMICVNISSKEDLFSGGGGFYTFWELCHEKFGWLRTLGWFTFKFCNHSCWLEFPT